MTKVNQLLEKALSTQSEEEAISCLRLARKRHTGEAVSIKDTESPAVQRSKEEYWRDQANKYFRIASERDQECSSYREHSKRYKILYEQCYLQNSSLRSDVEGLKLTQYFWKFLSLGLFAIIIYAAVY